VWCGLWDYSCLASRTSILVIDDCFERTCDLLVVLGFAVARQGGREWCAGTKRRHGVLPLCDPLKKLFDLQYACPVTERASGNNIGERIGHLLCCSESQCVKRRNQTRDGLAARSRAQLSSRKQID
jgi:hypothetical protein